MLNAAGLQVLLQNLVAAVRMEVIQWGPVGFKALRASLCNQACLLHVLDGDGVTAPGKCGGGITKGSMDMQLAQ